MKFATTLATLAFAMAVAASNAAECSMSELSDLTLKPETLALSTACASLNIDPTESDDTKIQQICADSPCFAAVEKFTSVLPTCTFQSISLSERYNQVVAECKKSGAASAAAATAPISAATAVAAVTAAIAAFVRV